MGTLKCKMCGGTIEFEECATVGICDSCGTKQTLPKSNDDITANLFNRANNLRLKCEFDKAAQIYEKIVQENDSEAEAHWGLVLCKYGIEYVEDPKTHERIPTCHRTLYEAITTDTDYQAAIDNSDALQKVIYEKEARIIDRIQKDILAIVKEENPFDVFLCYKETDDNGQRTPDSVIANDIYHQLTQEGFNVFYAAISLEDKLGKEYEPYIFSALNSAKVMLVIGTRQEYFSAVWVRNEWSRFLKTMQQDRNRLLIPCYKNMDPYELPEEFAHLQAQDMGKIGFIPDLIRGIKKVIAKPQKDSKSDEMGYIKQTVLTGSLSDVQIKRGKISLGDYDYEKADAFFEEALNIDPECAEAYIGKLLVRDRIQSLAEWTEMQKAKYKDCSFEEVEACKEDTQHISHMEDMFSIEGYLSPEKIHKLYLYNRCFLSGKSCRYKQKMLQQRELDEDRLLNHALEYANNETKNQIESSIKEINDVLDERIEEAKAQDDKNIEKIKTEYAEYLQNADKKAEALNAKALESRDIKYQDTVKSMEAAVDSDTYEQLKVAFNTFNGYKESEILARKCSDEAKRLKEEQIRIQEEKEEAERKYQEQKEENAKKKKTKITIIAFVVAIVGITAFLIIAKVIIPSGKYKEAMTLMENGEYELAESAFGELNEYKDAKEKELECRTKNENKIYEDAGGMFDNGDYENALEGYEKLGTYKDSQKKAEYVRKAIYYNNGIAYLNHGDYLNAKDSFTRAEDYEDAEIKLQETELKLEEKEKEGDYQEVLESIRQHKYDDLKDRLEALGDYKDCPEILKEVNQYYDALEYFDSGEIDKGIEYFTPFLDLIEKGKYIKLSYDETQFYKFYSRFIGNWTYSSGDDKLLSYTSKEPHSMRSIHIYYTCGTGGKKSIQLKEDPNDRFGEYLSLPNVDMEAGTITQDHYVPGDVVFSLKDKDTLLVDFYGNSGMPQHASVEYTRVE